MYGRLLVTIAVCAGLAGCQGLQRELGPDEAELLARDWLPRSAAPEPVPLYCYHTLGRVDCHPVPLKLPLGDERLTGAYGPWQHPPHAGGGR